MAVAALSGCKSRPAPPVEGPRLVGYIPGYTAQCRSLTDCERFGGGRGIRTPEGLAALAVFKCPVWRVVPVPPSAAVNTNHERPAGHGVPVDATSCRPVRGAVGGKLRSHKSGSENERQAVDGREVMPMAGDGEVINRAIASNDGALAPSQTQPNDGEECGMSEWMLSTLLAIGSVSLGLAKVLAAPSMRRRAAGGGISPIGALELAGAAGILVGLVEPLPSVCSRRPDRYCC